MRARIASALILAALIAVIGAVCPRPGVSEPVRATPPAWQLLQQSERSMVRIADAARLSAAGLRAGSPLYAPFWDALKEMDRALDEVRGSMEGRSQRFFHALRGGSRALAQLRVVWSRTGIDEPAVTRALESLGSSYRPLRAHYGPEQARAERGGGLTPQEQERFREIQRMQVRLIAVLQPLRMQAASRGDRDMTAQVDRLLERANDIANADLTLDEYLDASFSEDELMGEWDGNGPYVEPSYRNAWHEADAAVEELYVAEEAGFVFSLNLGDPQRPSSPVAGQPGVTVYGEAAGGEDPEPVEVDAEVIEVIEVIEVVEESSLAEAATTEETEETETTETTEEIAETGETGEIDKAGAESAAELSPAETSPAAEEAVAEPAAEPSAPISAEDIAAEDLPLEGGTAGTADPKTTTPENPPTTQPESGERKPPAGMATLAAILPL